MTKDILTDKTDKNKRHTLHRCFYCDHDKYPQGRVIMPYDKDAKITARGDHKCGVCVREDVRKSVSLFGRGRS
jgi:hypothetical protein